MNLQLFGYDDGYYYGMAKVIVISNTSDDDGKTVTITDGTKTWTGTMADKKCEFSIPGKNTYTVRMGSSSCSVDISYGECVEVYPATGKKEIAEIKANFQDGVDSCYNAVVSKGTTPSSKSLADVVAGINNISANGTLTLKGTVYTSAQWATSSGGTSSSGGSAEITGTVVIENGVVKSFSMSGSAPEQTSGWQTLSACWADASFTLTSVTWTPSK